MENFRTTLKVLSNDSNTRLLLILAIDVMIAAFLTFLYVQFIGQRFQGTIWAFGMPIFFALAGGAAVVAAILTNKQYADIGYAIMAFLLFVAAIASLLTTLALFRWVY